MANPSFYCEKEIKLNVLPFSNLRFKLFLIFILLSIVAGYGIFYSRRILTFSKDCKKIKKIAEKSSTTVNFSNGNQPQLAIPIVSEPYESIKVSASNNSERFII